MPEQVSNQIFIDMRVIFIQSYFNFIRTAYILKVDSSNTTSICTTSIIMVKLFVTTAQLAWSQTSVTTLKIGACNGYDRIRECTEHSLHVNTLHPQA